jgi:hypothetical protein
MDQNAKLNNVCLTSLSFQTATVVVKNRDMGLSPSLTLINPGPFNWLGLIK